MVFGGFIGPDRCACPRRLARPSCSATLFSCSGPGAHSRLRARRRRPPLVGSAWRWANFVVFCSGLGHRLRALPPRGLLRALCGAELHLVAGCAAVAGALASDWWRALRQRCSDAIIHAVTGAIGTLRGVARRRTQLERGGFCRGVGLRPVRGPKVKQRLDSRLEYG